MKLSRILIILVAVLLAAGIAFFVFSIHSRMTTSEYQFQVDAILAAAEVANNGETVTDPEKAVIAEYDGSRAVVAPGNYLALSSYLRKDAAMPLSVHIDRQKALKLTVCNEAVLYVMPEGGSGDVILIRLKTQGKTFGMRADGGNLWQSLLTCCMTGTYHDDNLPLE